MTIVVVAGIPGSGKTTLARELAPALGVPLLSKDVIKEALMDSLDTGDTAWASQLSRAAHVVMYLLVRDVGPDVVLEAHFHRGVAEQELQALGLPLLQIYCSCPVEIAWERYQRRRDDPSRHPGHRPEHQDEQATQHWRNTDPRPLDLHCPLIEVNTAHPVDIAGLVTSVRRLLQAPVELIDGQDASRRQV